MKNELELFESKQWYTVEELAELSGYDAETLKHGEKNLSAIMEIMSVNMEVNTRLGGYHNTKKFYSENVLKALKEYQIKTYVPNHLNNKTTAIEGNISVIQTQTVKSAISNLLDNPETLEMLLTESLARTKALGLENKQLKDVIEEQKPAVEYHSRLIDSNHLTSIRNTAKELQIPERKFVAALEGKKWIFRENGNIRAYAEKIRDGLLEEKDWEKNGKSGVQVYITVKGKQKLLKIEKQVY